MDEKTLYTKKIITRSKHFFVDLKENANGKFLRISENTGTVRNLIIVPEEGIKEFAATVNELLENLE